MPRAVGEPVPRPVPPPRLSPAVPSRSAWPLGLLTACLRCSCPGFPLTEAQERDPPAPSRAFVWRPLSPELGLAATAVSLPPVSCPPRALPSVHLSVCPAPRARDRQGLGCGAARQVTRRPSLPTAYGIGLLVTFMALALMQRGQPALLYLVPCTLVTSCALALWRGELGTFWTGSGFAVNTSLL